MRKFPETIATKQDVENIKNHPEYHKQLKECLQRAYDESEYADQVTDSDIDPATGEMINIKTRKVKKDMMKYKKLGFETKSYLDKFIIYLNPTHKTKLDKVIE